MMQQGPSPLHAEAATQSHAAHIASSRNSKGSGASSASSEQTITRDERPATALSTSSLSTTSSRTNTPGSVVVVDTGETTTLIWEELRKRLARAEEEEVKRVLGWDVIERNENLANEARTLAEMLEKMRDMKRGLGGGGGGGGNNDDDDNNNNNSRRRRRNRSDRSSLATIRASRLRRTSTEDTFERSLLEAQITFFVNKLRRASVPVSASAAALAANQQSKSSGDNNRPATAASMRNSSNTTNASRETMMQSSSSSSSVRNNTETSSSSSSSVIGMNSRRHASAGSSSSSGNNNNATNSDERTATTSRPLGSATGSASSARTRPNTGGANSSISGGGGGGGSTSGGSSYMSAKDVLESAGIDDSLFPVLEVLEAGKRSGSSSSSGTLRGSTSTTPAISSAGRERMSNISSGNTSSPSPPPPATSSSVKLWDENDPESARALAVLRNYLEDEGVTLEEDIAWLNMKIEQVADTVNHRGGGGVKDVSKPLHGGVADAATERQTVKRKNFPENGDSKEAVEEEFGSDYDEEEDDDDDDEAEQDVDTLRTMKRDLQRQWLDVEQQEPPRKGSNSVVVGSSIAASSAVMGKSTGSSTSTISHTTMTKKSTSTPSSSVIAEAGILPTPASSSSGAVSRLRALRGLPASNVNGPTEENNANGVKQDAPAKGMKKLAQTVEEEEEYFF